VRAWHRCTFVLPWRWIKRDQPHNSGQFVGEISIDGTIDFAIGNVIARFELPADNV